MYQEITDLYEQLHNELYRWCLVMTEDGFAAQELVQEGFLRAIDHFDEIKELSFSQKRAWLYRTIKNIFIDNIRKRKRECLTGDIPERTGGGDSYSEAELMQLVNSLPRQEGRIFTMRYIDGFTSGQIGRMLGIPPGTVRSRLSDARKHIREKM